MKHRLTETERLYRVIFYYKPFGSLILPLYEYGERFGRPGESMAAPWKPKQRRGRAAFWLAHLLDRIGLYLLLHGWTPRSRPR